MEISNKIPFSNPKFKNGLEPFQHNIIKDVLESRKKIVMINAPTGCHGVDTSILMYDGTVKMVQDIKTGNLLMGSDSKPKTVLQLYRGIDKMYLVTPTKGDPFAINSNHILSLKRTNDGTKQTGAIININLQDYLSRSKTFKHIHKLYRVPINFNNSTSLPLDPYFVGMYLGDGSTHCLSQPSITKPDKEILEECKKFASNHRLKLRVENDEDNMQERIHFKSGRKRKKNGSYEKCWFKLLLKSLGLIGIQKDKIKVPVNYKKSNKSDRLEILAGLLDTDGSMSSKGFDFLSKSKQLSEDVVYISRSLGLAAYLKPCYKKCQTGNGGIYYRVSISGNCSIIPTRIKRKQAPKRLQKKDVLVTGFKIKYIGKNNYYGFELDGDRLYCLGDFTVNHNSGKSPIGMTLAHHLNYPNQSLYLCISKILQDQLVKDFTEAYQLKGRSNYPCTLLPTYNADRCFQQCDEYKTRKISCAYEDAKKEALASTFTILNMHYYANETNYVGRFSKRKTVIIDEADVLEDILIDFIALNIHPKTLEKFKLDQPKYVTKLDSWKEWADKTLKILGEKATRLKATEDHLDRESKLELNKLSRMYLKLNMLKNDITEDWIFEHGERFRFQPLWLDTKLTQQYLLRHAERFIMMSATMLPKVIACKLLGLDINDVDYKEIDSPIPTASRPIIYKPIKELKYGESEDDVYREVAKIIDKHKGVKGFIPAVSYTRAKAIASLNKRCVTHNTYDKNEKIRQFLDSKDGVLVSPSCDRGLDLHGDLARFNIIVKVPFPNTTNKIVSKRIYGSSFGRLWYRAITAQTIVQQSGRTTRGISDSSTTYIFDAKFDSVVEFTPKWFQKAIKVEF